VRYSVRRHDVVQLVKYRNIRSIINLKGERPIVYICHFEVNRFGKRHFNTNITTTQLGARFELLFFYYELVAYRVLIVGD